MKMAATLAMALALTAALAACGRKGELELPMTGSLAPAAPVAAALG